MSIKTWQERPKINSVYGNNALMQDEIDDLRAALAAAEAENAPEKTCLPSEPNSMSK